MSVAFRVDASAAIGTGHFVRCLTLADRLKQRGLETRFICRSLPEHFRRILATKEHGLVVLCSSLSDQKHDISEYAVWLGVSQEQDANETIEGLADKTWDWLVVDHYALDMCWESRLREVVPNILVIDDLANRTHDCNLLLDQNCLPTSNASYSEMVPVDCKLLLGPRYALLREEFKAWHDSIEPRSGDVKRIFVFFGGVDAYGYTEHTIEALGGISHLDLRVDVVIGAQNPRREQIMTLCHQYSFDCHIEVTNMAELMAMSDMAVGAGGVNVWERCSVGLPAIVICIAENQKAQVEDAAREGLIYLPDMKNHLAQSIQEHVKALSENKHLRHYFSIKGMQLVDGGGVDRVIAAMSFKWVDVRKATPKDCEKLFYWRNHPDIRKVSRNSEVIQWEDHKRWFDSVLTDPNRALLVGMHAGSDLGVIRFDIKADEAEVSIYLSPEKLASKMGQPLLSAAEQWLHQHMPDISRIRAIVSGENGRSASLFHKAGYRVELRSLIKELH
jgi:UDP-2,4-diacetamido-2,4,6-trideoxy-beta-L-altropyranose hydrolase